jgi:serine/threonine protein kinase
MVQKQPSYRTNGNSSELTNKISQEKMAQYHHHNWRLGQWLYEGSQNIELDKEKGKYVLQKTLGKGGFGITYLAKDKTGKQVVIKTLNEDVQRRPDFNKYKDDFYNEAMSLARCDDPHIVSVRKIIHEEGLPCIVMEYIDGENIEQRVQVKGSLEENEAIKYIKQIAEALIKVHDKGWLHRDVKPQNILIRKDGTDAVLIDFGIARYNDDGTITACWTPHYAPPEQCNPKGKHGHYSDVYSLAATLYFMVTANKPTSANDRIKGHTFVPPQQINPNISDKVNNAILKGMKIEPENRPQEVQEWIDLLPIDTVSTTKKQKVPKFLFWVPPLIGVTILGLVFLAFWVTEPSCQKELSWTICRKMADVPVPKLFNKVHFSSTAAFAALTKPEILDNRINQAHADFQLKHFYPSSKDEAPNSRKVIRWLMEGKDNLSFVLTSLRMTPNAHKEVDKYSKKLEEVEFARNIYAVYVNPQLTKQGLKSLTLDDLARIFAGEVTNWQDVNGPNLPIIPVRLKRTDSENFTVDDFQEKVLGEQRNYTQNIKGDIVKPSDAIDYVAKTPGSISFVTASQAINQQRIRILPIAKDQNVPPVSPCADDACTSIKKNLESYPDKLTGSLYVVIKKDSGLHEQAGITVANMFLSDEGQKLVQDMGFIPVRKIESFKP